MKHGLPKSNRQSSIFLCILSSVFCPLSSVFMQNKPNFTKSQINISSFMTIKYAKLDNWLSRKTNPIQTQIYPRCVLTCFGVYPRICLPVFLPGIGDKPNLPSTQEPDFPRILTRYRMNPIFCFFSTLSFHSAKMAQKLTSPNPKTTSRKNVTSYKQTC